MNNKQSGSVHAIVVGVLIVCLVGAIGFIFWQNFLQPNANDNTTASVAESNEKTDSKKASSLDWETTYSGERFTMKLPDGWKFLELREYYALYSNDEVDNPLVYQSGTPASVTEDPKGAGDMRWTISLNRMTPAQYGPTAPWNESDKVETLTSTSGVAVTKYRHEYKSGDNIYYPDGMIEYQYVFKDGGEGHIALSYKKLPGKSDVTSYLDEMVKSVVIKK